MLWTLEFVGVEVVVVSYVSVFHMLVLVSISCEELFYFDGFGFLVCSLSVFVLLMSTVG